MSTAEPQPLEPQPEESHIVKVDPKLEENNAKHHTDQMSTSQLIVRRGQSFSVGLRFKESFNPAVNSLLFTATLGNIPDEVRGTRSVFGIPDTVRRAPNAKAIWKAELTLDQKKSRNVVVKITPPADAPIGIYTLTVNYLGEEKKLGFLALIFNPWCPEDSVYMKNEKKVQEYVLNEHGVIFKGSGNYIFPMHWDYGQFEDDMVDIALALLYVSPEYLTDPMADEAARCDPIYVGRIISRMINSEGDRGVLEGRWGGPYIGGMAPSHWSGSYPILKRWYNIGCHPVKFGQCWVFAAVMCSVLRTLGIPCRVITNYESAHDCDKNLIIDQYHADYGVEEIPSPDSVWNFHVWCEGWMKRPDLADVKFDGWQVLDPTPQELSGGTYQCGPAAVRAILDGNTDKDYDVPFVFAEVNADCHDYLVKADGSKELFWSDPKRVGQNISTKSVGSNKRRTITSRYKHKEGSEKERSVFKYAITREYTKDDDEDWEEEEFEDSEDEGEEPQPEPEKPPVNLPKVSLKFEEVSKPVNGKDVELNLVLHSEASEPRTLSVNINVEAKSINGTARYKILSDKKEKTLKPGKDLRVPVLVPFSKYWPKMLDNDVMKVTAIVKDTGDNKEKYLAEDDVVLEDPPFKVKVLGEALVRQPLYLEMSFANPVSETLKSCSITLSGSGLMKEEEEISLPDLGPKRRIRVKVCFYPRKAGKKTLMADFNCSVFRDIKKSVPVVVKKSNLL